MTFSYISHQLKAKKRHGVHSPFVYNLSEEVLYSKGAKRASEIEKLRQRLSTDPREVELIDLGAGSRVNSGNLRSVSEMVKTSSTPIQVAQMLQRLVIHSGHTHLLEVGTNLGLTSAYLAASSDNAKFIGLEGDPFLASEAVKNLKSLGLNGKILQGPFSETLDLAIDDLAQIDFAYIDGNHQYKPTIEYFKKISQVINSKSVIAVGDIHWSMEMTEAWEEIKEDSNVSLTIDLFHLGLVFFQTGRHGREHFRLKL